MCLNIFFLKWFLFQNHYFISFTTKSLGLVFQKIILSSPGFKLFTWFSFNSHQFVSVKHHYLQKSGMWFAQGENCNLLHLWMSIKRLFDQENCQKKELLLIDHFKFVRIVMCKTCHRVCFHGSRKISKVYPRIRSNAIFISVSCKSRFNTEIHNWQYATNI